MSFPEKHASRSELAPQMLFGDLKSGKQALQEVQLKLQRNKIPARHRKFLGEYKNFMSQKMKIPLHS